MSQIDISHEHTLTGEQARATIEQVAEALRQRYELQTRWQGDVLAFARSGVDGEIELCPGCVRVRAQLGFPLAMMRGAIEDEIRSQIQRKFGSLA